jgi:hypothetical protein
MKRFGYSLVKHQKRNAYMPRTRIAAIIKQILEIPHINANVQNIYFLSFHNVEYQVTTTIPLSFQF